MKVLRLTEKIKNLNRVIDNKTINAVTEMNPVMSDAYEDSLELDQAIENELKDSDLLVKDKPFLGASKQPTPKKIEDPKLNLDESLFEDVPGGKYYLPGIEDASYEEGDIWIDEDPPFDSGEDAGYSSQEGIFDFLDNSDIDDRQDMIEAVSDEFGMDPSEATRWVDAYIRNSEAEWHDTADQEDEEDIPIDILKDYLDSIEVEDEFTESLSKKNQINEGYSNSEYEVNAAIEHFWNDLGKDPDVDDVVGYLERIYPEDIPDTVEEYNKWYQEVEQIFSSIMEAEDSDSTTSVADWSDETDVEFDESLNEEDKSKLSWDELGTEEAENADIWNLVYSTLLKERDLAANNMVKRYNTPKLSLKQRYSDQDISTDMDGNIIVYAGSEEELEPAQEVAEFHGFESLSKQSPVAWAEKRPTQAYSLTIIIPESELDRPLERRNPGKGRGRPKKIKEEE